MAAVNNSMDKISFIHKAIDFNQLSTKQQISNNK